MKIAVAAMVVLALAAALSKATAQEPNCRAIENDLERLSCYDAFFGTGTTEPADQAVQACERRLEGTLISPASYRRVDAQIIGRMLLLTFDSANSYGALLRGKETCHFEFYDGNFYLAPSNELRSEARMAYRRMQARTPILASSTKLEPISSGIESCLDAFLKGAPRPTYGDFEVSPMNTKFRDKVGVHVSTERPIPGLPKSGRCFAHKDGRFEAIVDIP